MNFMQVWELLSYIVRVIGLPLAIFVFLYQQRKARENEEEQINQLLSDGYIDFLKLTIDNPDLKLRSNIATTNLTDEQRERMLGILGILISLFERAYMVAYGQKMSPRETRRWRAWEGFMREWCRREDFRDSLPLLLPGEDPDFTAFLQGIAADEAAKANRLSSDVKNPAR
ncbi:hypothetical protein [Rhizobium sp. R693]|uniref:hypothetical protein n=1 Tax=Rhizobium sp. R693 TaxID=1764276 RepID=UPI000B530045|nr:hypothetical protein [Rhizobium sp. R693]OWW00315.1 hypothetical protein ATY79_02100 [Rhizobium sp. R693]